MDIEPADHVRTASERDDRVSPASGEFKDARNRVLVFREHDEVWDVPDPRGPESHEILVALSAAVRHPRDVIAREILLPHDVPDLREVLGRYPRRRDLNVVERCDGTPSGADIDLQSVPEVRREGGATLEPEHLVFPAPSPPFDRSRVQRPCETNGPIKTFLRDSVSTGPKGLNTEPR